MIAARSSTSARSRICEIIFRAVLDEAERLSPCPVEYAQHRWVRRIFYLYPRFASTRAVREIAPLGYDPFESQLARMLKYSFAVAVDMLGESNPIRSR
jgi:hypothetical protein